MAVIFEDGVINLEIAVPLTDVSGNDLHPMLDRLPKMSASQTQLKWNADVGGETNVGELVTADALDSTDPGTIVPASLPIATARLRETFDIPTVQAAEAASAGEGVLANLLALTSRGAVRQLVRKMAQLVYTGTGAVADAGMIGLAGLHTAVTAGAATNVYAGIDPATYDTWTTYVNTAGTNRALTTTLLYQMSEQIWGGQAIGVTGNFTALYMSPAMATKYKLLFEASADITVGTNPIAALGYSGMSFEGRPIFMDPGCPANTIYFVDESEVMLYTFTEGAVAFGDEGSAEGLNLKFVQLARTNPDSVKIAVVTKPQLKVARRPSVAVLNAIVQ